MNRDKAYYQNLLHYSEHVLLETVGDLLQIEIAIYEVRKLLQEMRDMGEFNNPKLDGLKLSLERIRSKHGVLSNEIDDLELDISHAKFMIDNLSQNTDEHESGES